MPSLPVHAEPAKFQLFPAFTRAMTQASSRPAPVASVTRPLTAASSASSASMPGTVAAAATVRSVAVSTVAWSS